MESSARSQFAPVPFHRKSEPEILGAKWFVRRFLVDFENSA